MSAKCLASAADGKLIPGPIDWSHKLSPDAGLC